MKGEYITCRGCGRRVEKTERAMGFHIDMVHQGAVDVLMDVLKEIHGPNLDRNMAPATLPHQGAEEKP